MATVKKSGTDSSLSKSAAQPIIKKTAAKRPSAGSAFMKAMTPSPALAAVIGPTPVPRTEVTKKLWVYIKEKGLQDAKQRTMINADAKLLPIFQKPQVSMFEMTKLVNAHLS
jgi:chromatin remodeling complex protein RSC6